MAMLGLTRTLSLFLLLRPQRGADIRCIRPRHPLASLTVSPPTCACLPLDPLLPRNRNSAGQTNVGVQYINCCSKAVNACRMRKDFKRAHYLSLSYLIKGHAIFHPVAGRKFERGGVNSEHHQSPEIWADDLGAQSLTILISP